MLERIVMTEAGRFSAGKSIVSVAAATFVVALLALAAIGRFAPPVPQVALMAVAALVIAVVVAVLVHYALVAPLVQHYQKKLHAVPQSPLSDRTPITDTMTRTLNRRGITIGLFDLMALADRYEHPLSVAMVDVDRLGQVNERHGKSAGDQVLASVAGILADTLRMPDRLGRYNDNEFLIILPETEMEDACRLAERIRANTADTDIDVNGETIKTTVSMGVTQFRRGEDPDQLVSRAEGAIRDAKNKGRNCVVCVPAPADPRKRARAAG